MLPRWHIFLGAVFTLILYYFETNLLYLSLVFLSSFLIDFDHYAASVIKTGKLSLLASFEYHKKQEIIEQKERKRGIRRKGDFHLFHTIEFHLLIFLLGFVWIGFWFIFIGMAFHSILDIISMAKERVLYRREFLLINWLQK